MFRRSMVLGATLSSAILFAACGGGGASSPTPTGNAATTASTTTSAPRTSFQTEIANGYVRKACDAPAAAGMMSCDAYVLTDAGRSALGFRAQADVSTATTPSGYGPTQLEAAYGLNTSGGSGRTVALVEAGDSATLENDLGVYRSQYGLSACTTANGCFKKVNQTGGSSLPAEDASWEEETSLDVDMVSANCPNCKIVVVEANSATTANLAAATKTAMGLGVVAISNSYGGSESSSETSYAADYSAPAGIVVTASNGDDGYGVEVPAAYNTVTAVGGTTLDTASNSRGWTETVWSGSGSGCSKYISKPTWQKDTGCTKRTVGDVGYIGDPNTGVAVYDSTPYEGYSGWLVFGGTSVGAPSIAAIYALSGNSNTASYIYAHTGDLNDVTSGSNGSCSKSAAYLCTGEVGYDGPTGNGTPNGTGAF